MGTGCGGCPSTLALAASPMHLGEDSLPLATPRTCGLPEGAQFTRWPRGQTENSVAPTAATIDAATNGRLDP